MSQATGAMYKDSSANDFAHYFNNTAMCWHIGLHKRRLFLVQGIEGGSISGSYLTREGEWKEKRIDWSKWYEVLDPIAPHPLRFNLEDGAGIWYPNLSRNLRKSFPWTTNTIKFYGKRRAEEVTTQGIGHRAFSDFYGQKMLPTISEAITGPRQASVTVGDFLVDKPGRRLYFHRAEIGEIYDTKVRLYKKTRTFKDLIMSYGLAESDIIVPDLKDKTESKPDPVQSNVEVPLVPLPMAVNPTWVQGYEPGTFIGPAYSVRRMLGAPGQGWEYRTYSGPHPPAEWLSPGWGMHNSWGQQ